MHFRPDVTGRAAGATLAAAAFIASFASLRPRALDLEGRVVLVTGGSRGLGLAIAREAATHKARLVLLARDERELADARAELERTGAEVLTFACDVTKRDEVRNAVSRAVEQLRRIDVLVNNAGVIEVGPIEEMTGADFDVALATHIEGPLNLVREVVPHMTAAGGGRVVNIASIGGLVPVPHLAPYSASKFGLVGLSESLRVELAKDGIVVTTVCPGLMRTGSGRAASFRGDARAERAENGWFRTSALAPLLSMSAEDAARKIIRACQRGDGRVVLGVPAKTLALAHGVAPNTVDRALSLVARLLPGPSRDPAREPVSGREIPLRTSWLQRLDDRVAFAHNEVREDLALRPARV